MLPASAVSSPAMMRSSVVLPQPEGPSSAISSPDDTSRLTSRRAWKSPKRLLTLRISMLMVSAFSRSGRSRRGPLGRQVGDRLHFALVTPLDEGLDHQR